MTLFRTEPPLGLPVTLDQAKAHMRVETADEDELVGDLIAVATTHLEAETGLALMTQSWRLVLDAWPDCGTIAIRRTPVQAVDAVTVYDADGTPADIDASNAVLDGHDRPARFHIGSTAQPAQALNGIEIDFTAGFGDAATDVPDALKRAILLHVAHMYAFRGAVPVAVQPAGVPAGYDRLIAPWRRRTL